MKLHNKNCFEFFEEYKGDHDIDCVIVDLPYGQTGNKWDVKIDLDLMWKHLLKICKRNCVYVFFCTTKFGVDLINAKPNYFKYDLVWEKKNSVGHLSVKKIPLRKHEMVYVFGNPTANDVNKEFNKDLREYSKKLFENIKDDRKTIFKKCGNQGLSHFIGHSAQQFGIPTEKNYIFLIKEYDIDKLDFYKTHEELKDKWVKNSNVITYNPQMTKLDKPVRHKTKTKTRKTNYGIITEEAIDVMKTERHPTTILNYGYDKEKLHTTQKPVALLEWLVKTYTNKGETVLDFTMGSGSCGVACKNTGREFIGVELDKEIFEIAKNRLY